MTFPTTIIISPQKITSQTKEDESNKAKQVEFINALSYYSWSISVIRCYQEVYLYLIDEYTRKPTIPYFNDRTIYEAYYSYYFNDRKRGKVNISYE